MAIPIDSRSSDSRRPSTAIQGILIFLTVIAVYLPSLQNRYIWDDDQYVTKNPSLRTVGGLADVWVKPTASPQYYPLVFTTFWIEFHLWGLNPIGYHLDNVLLHGISCWLLLGLLRRLGVAGAGWATVLFAVHPVMIESVAWITERKNVLSAALTLWAMRFAIDAWELTDAPPRPHRRVWAYFACLLWFIAAMLSKTVACTFPIAVLLLIWWRRGRIRLAEVWRLVPLLAIGGGFACITAWLERRHVGASGANWHFSIGQRILLAGRAPWFYLAKLLKPSPLIFIYPRWTLRCGEPLQWLAPIGAVAVLLALWFARGRLGRGPLVLAALFVVTLIPALGFVNVYPFLFSFVADHFQYLASVPVFVGIGWAWACLPASFQKPAGVAVLGLLCVLTWHRQRVFEDAVALWTDTADRNPSAWIAFNNLGVLDYEAGNYPASIGLLKRAVAIDKDAPQLQGNLGIVLLRMHRSTEAEAALSLAVEQEPNSAVDWAGLGNAHADCGHDAAARTAFERAHALDPGNVQTLADLAWLEATSSADGVRDPTAALALAKAAETRSSGYNIRAVEARAAAEAALGDRHQAAADASRAASMSAAAGERSRAAEDRRRAAGYASAETGK